MESGHRDVLGMVVAQLGGLRGLDLLLWRSWLEGGGGGVGFRGGLDKLAFGLVFFLLCGSTWGRGLTRGIEIGLDHARLPTYTHTPGLRGKEL